MCDTCGCGNGNNPVKISRPGEPAQEHHHDHEHPHPHSHGHHHDHDHPHPHSSDSSRQRLIRVEEDILGKNKLLAARNRGYFEAKGVVTLNLMSSPGSGKTTLLEKTIEALQEKRPLAVIEGDQQTLNDAERIHKTGAPVVQVNTGNGCHLDADMIRQALDQLDLKDQSILFIENVGNLVCPSLFELGEKNRIVIISVTEGEDKPLKYPTMFEHAQTCIINKTDLLPYVDFDMELVKKHAHSVNPNLHILELSARTGEGMDAWIKWLLDLKS
ncbi:MAG: hydrogenase nickel incorporation protein HypB [Bacteroidota bacterium]|nr:hydrogenase nickel incorporation protein HypB [Bacteroidota bacterium]